MACRRWMRTPSGWPARTAGPIRGPGRSGRLACRRDIPAISIRSVRGRVIRASRGGDPAFGVRGVAVPKRGGRRGCGLTIRRVCRCLPALMACIDALANTSGDVRGPGVMCGSMRAIAPGDTGVSSRTTHDLKPGYYWYTMENDPLAIIHIHEDGGATLMGTDYRVEPEGVASMIRQGERFSGSNRRSSARKADRPAGRYAPAVRLAIRSERFLPACLAR